jgi:hypothetical protein
LSIILKSGSSTDTADVTPDNALKVAMDGADPDLAGYVKLLDSDGHPILTTENGALDVSVDSLVLYEQVDGSAVNTNLWTTSTSGMTIAQANGFITLNSGSAVTANSYAILTSIKSVPLYGHLPLKVTLNISTPNLAQANATIEAGIGMVATTAAPTDGCFFRWNSSGDFKAVVNNGGAETTSPVLAAVPQNDVTLLDIVVVEDLVQFLVDDVLVAEISVPTAQAYPTAGGRLPVFLRVNTGGSPPAAAPVISLGQMVVVQQALNQVKPWCDVLAGLGRGAHQSPVTTFAQTANHANSTSPASATLSNTAAGYTTLGGRWQFAAPAGAATDFALFAYQVPAGYQLFIDSISISAINTGATVGTTATILDWSIAANASAVSLATADGAGTWAPRRRPLGVQGFLVGDLIGKTANDIVRSFATPMVVDGGRFLHVIVQVPVGTATASQVIRGDVQIDGYFE